MTSARRNRDDVVRIHPTISEACKNQINDLVEDENTDYKCIADVIEDAVLELSLEVLKKSLKGK